MKKNPHIIVSVLELLANEMQQGEHEELEEVWRPLGALRQNKTASVEVHRILGAIQNKSFENWGNGSGKLKREGANLALGEDFKEFGQVGKDLEGRGHASFEEGEICVEWELGDIDVVPISPEILEGGSMDEKRIREGGGDNGQEDSCTDGEQPKRRI